MGGAGGDSYRCLRRLGISLGPSVAQLAGCSVGFLRTVDPWMSKSRDAAHDDCTGAAHVGRGGLALAGRLALACAEEATPLACFDLALLAADTGGRALRADAGLLDLDETTPLSCFELFALLAADAGLMAAGRAKPVGLLDPEDAGSAGPGALLRGAPVLISRRLP